MPALALSAPPPVPERLLIEIDAGRKVARVGGSVILRKANFGTLAPLAEAHLESLGAGCAPEDFALLHSRQLWEIWDLKDESSVRRRIKLLRKAIAPAVVETEAEIIENLPWKGYRLKPELVTVRRVSLAGVLKPPPGKPAPVSAATRSCAASEKAARGAGENLWRGGP